MSKNHSLHRAVYDSDGNIILGGAIRPSEPQCADEGEPVRVHEKNAEPEERLTRLGTWSVTGEEPRAQAAAQPVTPKQLNVPRKVSTPLVAKKEPSTIASLRKTTGSYISAALTEGKKQLSATVVNAKSDVQEAGEAVSTVPARARGLLRRFWKVASAPVSMPGKKSKRKKSKLELFAVDTVRFGGTFAAIFTVLFVGINYRSFLQIAKAELAIGNDIQTEQALEQMVRGTRESRDTSFEKRISALKSEGNVLAYLPEVGPFDDSLVIPKIGKNVPIVRPSMDALMREDWKQFEKDIQTALQDGVVHYPGSARPGQAGNFFITGHSSDEPWDPGDYKAVFARLHELVLGDTYSVYYGGDKHTYRIIEKKEVKPNDVSVLDQPTDKRLATLMTCTPVGTAIARLILVSQEIDSRTGEVLAVGEKADETSGKALRRLEALPI